MNLVDDSDNIVSSSPFYPGNGGYPTSQWQPGDVIVSVRDLAFDESVASGRYRLTLNLQFGKRMIDLGSIDISESPPSLIPAEGLFRIGDVEVLSGNDSEKARNAAGKEPVEIARNIELLDWQLSREKTRYMEYLNSCARRVDHKNSNAVFFDRFDDSGARFSYDMITMLHPESEGCKGLMEDLIQLAETMKVVETGQKVFRRTIRNDAQYGFKVELDTGIFLGEKKVYNVAFMTYDARQHIEFSFRGDSYLYPLGTYLKNKCVGFHQNEGVYIISGQDIPNLGFNGQALEWDIAPTVMKLSQVSVPAGLDGDVISWDNQHKDAHKAKEAVLTNEDLYEQLQAIGYLSNL